MPAVGATGAVARAGGGGLRRAPERVHRRPAGAAVADPRGRRVTDRDAVRREPHRRAADAGRAGHAAGPGRDRGQPVLRARRRRPPGRGSRRRVQRARRRHPGRLDADPAVRQDHPAGEGPAQQRQGRRPGGRRAPGAGRLQPQAAGAQVRRHGREAADQGPDPRGLPQPRLLRRPGLRRRGRRAATTSGSAPPPLTLPQAAHARRPDPAPGRHRPGALPRGGPRPAQRRARPDAPAAADQRQAVDHGQGPARSSSTSRPRRTPAPPRPTPTSATTSSPGSSSSRRWARRSPSAPRTSTAAA